MPAPQDTAESAEPPTSATRGAEIAPLVEAEPSPAELLRKAHEEIEDAEARLRRCLRHAHTNGLHGELRRSHLERTSACRFARAKRSITLMMA